MSARAGREEDRRTNDSPCNAYLTVQSTTSLPDPTAGEVGCGRSMQGVGNDGFEGPGDARKWQEMVGR